MANKLQDYFRMCRKKISDRVKSEMGTREVGP